MAGAFGYAAETIDVSRKMGELSLLPAVRRAEADALIVADGTSCRHQIHDGSDREAAHVARVLAMSVAAAPGTPTVILRRERRSAMPSRSDASRAQRSISQLFPTSLVGSYAQPEWLIDRAKLASRFPPRVRARELWRVAPELPQAGAGRRDPACDPRSGAGRPRHHHRRRDAARKLFQSFCHRARRRRHR